MIRIKPSREGLLHKRMGLKQGKKISEGSLEKEKSAAKKDHDVKELREVVFAENARKWHHK
jgi:hypothetical protein